MAIFRVPLYAHVYLYHSFICIFIYFYFHFCLYFYTVSIYIYVQVYMYSSLSPSLCIYINSYIYFCVSLIKVPPRPATSPPGPCRPQPGFPKGGSGAPCPAWGAGGRPRGLWQGSTAQAVGALAYLVSASVSCICTSAQYMRVCAHTYDVRITHAHRCMIM